MRGLAVLAVFFHHVCYSTLYVTGQAGWSPLIVKLFYLFRHGDHGVDLFFVLSGFLITSILIKERQSARYYQDFYWKRVLRIMPLYAVCLVGILLFMHQPGYVALSALLLVNFSSVFHISGIGPYWSLAIEEQFYLLWPTVVRRRIVSQTLRWALGIGVGCAALRFLFALHGNHNYNLSFLRCDGLAFGAVLACHFHTAGSNRKARHAWDLGLLALIAVALLLFLVLRLPLSGSMLSAIEQTSVVLFTGSFVGLAIAYSGATALAPLRSSVLTFFGLISYAFYMVQLYVIAAYDNLRRGLQPGDVRGYWIRMVIIFTITLALSLLSRYLIELPAMRLRRYVLKHPHLEAEQEQPPLPLAQM